MSNASRRTRDDAITPPTRAKTHNVRVRDRVVTRRRGRYERGGTKIRDARRHKAPLTRTEHALRATVISAVMRHERRRRVFVIHDESRVSRRRRRIIVHAFSKSRRCSTRLCHFDITRVTFPANLPLSCATSPARDIRGNGHHSASDLSLSPTGPISIRNAL